MNRLDNKTCCLVCLIIIAFMTTGCSTSRKDFVEMCLDASPPEELMALLDSPKRLIRVFSLSHNESVDSVEWSVNKLLGSWYYKASETWPGVEYRSYRYLTATGYTYKDFYLFQLHSEESGVIPMGILVPKDQGIIVLVNPYEPEIGIPWEFDHYTPHSTGAE